MIFLIIGIIVPVVFGFLVYQNFVRNRNPSESLSFSIGFGFSFLYILLHVENRYLGMSFSLSNLLSTNLFMVFISLILWIKNKHTLNLSSSKEYFEIVKKYLISYINTSSPHKYILMFLSILYVIVFYKSIFFPILGEDTVKLYSYLSKRIFIDQSLPSSYSIIYDSSGYSTPNMPLLIPAYLSILGGSYNEIYLRIMPPLTSLLCSLLIVRLSNQCYPKMETGLYSLALFLFIPSAVYISIEFMQDIFMLFFFLLSINFLLKFNTYKNTKYLVLSAFFLGISSFCKYNAVMLFPPVIMTVLILYYKQTSTKSENKLIAYDSYRKVIIFFILPLLFTISPVIIWKIINLGDPFYPILFGRQYSDSIVYQSSDALSNYYILKLAIKPFYPFIYQIGLLVPCFCYIFYKNNKDAFNFKTNISIIFFIGIWSFSFILIYGLVRGHSTTAISRYVIPGYCLMAIVSSKYLLDVFKSRKFVQERKNIYIFFLCSYILYILSYNVFRVLFGKSTGLSELNSIVSEIINYYFLAGFLSPFIFIIILIYATRYFSKNYSRNQFLYLVMVIILIPPYVTALEYRHPFIDNSYPFIDVIPEEEVLKEYYGPDIIDMINWINHNTDSDSSIVTYTNLKYYFERDIFTLNSVYFEEIHKASNFSIVLNILHTKGINYYLEVPFESKAVFMMDYDLYHNCSIRTNLDNDNVTLAKSYGDVKLYRLNYL